MFCPKCGSGEQSPESYCRQCGEWLRDPDAGSSGRGIFRATTRDEKIRKIRILELVSIGLSLTSAAIIFSVLVDAMDQGLLFLAMACGIVVAFYQAANMYLGHKVTSTLPRERPAKDLPEGDSTPVQMPHAATRRLNVPASVSVTEDTTDLLDPVPHSDRKDRSS